MKKRSLLFCMLILSAVGLFSAFSAPSENVLRFVDLLENTEFSTYADFEDALNYDTIDGTPDEKFAFSTGMIYFTKKDNLYCAPVFLDGIKDKMLAMMQIEGSGRFPYLRIFRFDGRRKKWTLYFSASGASGECGLVYPVSEPNGGRTLFLEEEKNFDNKRLVAYNLLELKNKKWKKISQARARYVYDLGEEEKEWISADIIEKMAAFDYSFMGISGDHPSRIEREAGAVKIVAEPYYTSVGYMASNFDIKIIRRTTEDELFKISEGQWGFNIVEKSGKNYLVCIGMGDDWKTGERVSTIESFMLTVFDLSAFCVPPKVVFKKYIRHGIVFE